MHRKTAFVLILLAFFPAAGALSAQPRNAIFFIGDGMGFQEVKAASLYAGGKEGSLFFEGLPYRGEAATSAADGSVTDSAAAATAIATGRKVDNGVISVAIPGDGADLLTLLEYFRDQGKSTGLVTTTYMTHATPAAFGAHAKNRGETDEIGNEFFTQTKPNVLFGGGDHGVSKEAAVAAGYTVVTTREEMRALNTDDAHHVSGQFGGDHLPYEYDCSTGADAGCNTLPHLTEMVETALDILDNDPEGFFLMVEGGRIDHAGHENNIRRNVFETTEFAKAVRKAVEWAGDRRDTLIIVTADHETGGLEVVEGKGAGEFPEVTWGTGGHTGKVVPVYGWGMNADKVPEIMDNTDFFDLAVGGGDKPSRDEEED